MHAIASITFHVQHRVATPRDQADQRNAGPDRAHPARPESGQQRLESSCLQLVADR